MYLDIHIHRMALRRTLNLGDKLPADFEATFENVACHRHPPEWDKDKPTSDALIGHFDIVITKAPIRKSKSSEHRVFVKCKCGRLIPTGRMHQHKCDHWPRQEDIDLAKKRRKEYDNRNKRVEPIPADFAVQPVKPFQTTALREAGAILMTCEHCRLTWEDSKVTSMTPVPSGRCPFEAFHYYPE